MENQRLSEGQRLSDDAYEGAQWPFRISGWALKHYLLHRSEGRYEIPPLVIHITHLYYSYRGATSIFLLETLTGYTGQSMAEVATVLLPNLDRASYPKMMALCKRYP